MWYKTAIREELVEKILRKLPKRMQEQDAARKYVHDYVYRLELGSVRPGDQELIKDCVMAAYYKKEATR